MDENPQTPNSEVDQIANLGQETDQNSKTFTQEEVNDIVKERINRANVKFEEKLSTSKTEWERQAKLTAEEKAAEESKRRADELAQREREVALAKSEITAIKLLSEHNIDPKFSQYLVNED